MHGKRKSHIYIHVALWYKGSDEENKSMSGDPDSTTIYKQNQYNFLRYLEFHCRNKFRDSLKHVVFYNIQ